jgi:type II secretory ATPase GspE/PulE/Tfp pilus assembly ATPase PilB-like protein
MEEASFRKGAGCEHCANTGFQGRSSVTELLKVDQIFRDAVLQKMPTKSLHQIATDQGMTTMWANGMRRVIAGQTTLEEVLRVVATDEM